jgi:hypothetical protein
MDRPSTLQLAGVFERLLRRLFRPFSDADTIEEYAAAGYWLFGVLLLLVLSGAWLGGKLEWFLQFVYLGVDVAGELIGLRRVALPPELPSGLAVGLLYFGVYQIKAVRLFIGRGVADLFFGAANRMIGFGEWCIRHRTLSTILIFLVLLVTLDLFRRERETARRQYTLSDGLEDWIDQAVIFTTSGTFTAAEVDSHRLLEGSWHPSFDKVLGGSTSEVGNPILTLNHLLRYLHAAESRLSGDNRLSWGQFLSESSDSIALITKNYMNVKTRVGSRERKAQNLLALTLGRVFVRLSGPECDNAEALTAAFGHFRNVSDRRLESDRMNGFGTVYACVASVLLRVPTSREFGADQVKELREICASVEDCSVRGLRAYRSSAKNADQCSFTDKRRRNNMVDLLTRLGNSYTQLNTRSFDYPFSDWIDTPSSFRDRLRAETDSMVNCSSRSPLIPALFVTAAQAHGTIAFLSLAASDSAGAAQAHKAAGHFLRLAYALQPSNLDDWDVRSFCSALTADGDLRAEFLSGIDSPIPGFSVPEVVTLRRRIVNQCQ